MWKTSSVYISAYLSSRYSNLVAGAADGTVYVLKVLSNDSATNTVGVVALAGDNGAEKWTLTPTTSSESGSTTRYGQYSILAVASDGTLFLSEANAQDANNDTVYGQIEEYR